MSDQSEEKTLPASQTKLRKSREKGQIAKSKDLVSVLVTVSVLLVLATLGGYWFEKLTSLYHLAGQSVNHAQNGEIIPAALHTAREVLLIATLLFSVAIGVAVLTNLVQNKGVPFSLDPITPNFSRLNLAQGFRRVFGIRFLVDGSQIIGRVAIWLAVAITIVWLLLSDLMTTFYCGFSCTQLVGMTLFTRLLAAAILFLIIIALLDVPLQIHLFMRQQKMSHSEQKQERRQLYGSPEAKRERKRMHREILNEVGGSQQKPEIPLGLENASIVVFGSDAAVALIYTKGETPVPVVADKATGKDVPNFLAKASALNKISVPDNALAEELARLVPKGEPITKEFYSTVAQLLTRYSLV